MKSHKELKKCNWTDICISLSKGVYIPCKNTLRDLINHFAVTWLKWMIFWLCCSFGIYAIIMLHDTSFPMCFLSVLVSAAFIWNTSVSFCYHDDCHTADTWKYIFRPWKVLEFRSVKTGGTLVHRTSYAALYSVCIIVSYRSLCDSSFVF